MKASPSTSCHVRDIWCKSVPMSAVTSWTLMALKQSLWFTVPVIHFIMSAQLGTTALLVSFLLLTHLRCSDKGKSSRLWEILLEKLRYLCKTQKLKTRLCSNPGVSFCGFEKRPALIFYCSLWERFYIFSGWHCSGLNKMWGKGMGATSPW